MGLRLSITEAQQKKLINGTQARELRRLQKARRPSTSPKTSSSNKTPSGICPIEGATPQEKLWRALVHRYPELVKSGDLCWELVGAVPGRKFSIDTAFLDMKLAIELDGWEFHGKNINNFKRDRQKDRLLMLEGWRVLRFFASEVNNEIDSVVGIIERARLVIAAEREGTLERLSLQIRKRMDNGNKPTLSRQHNDQPEH